MRTFSAAALAFGLAASLPAQSASPEVRALWVTRWDYTSPEHVTAIMENAHALNFNMILFQVRGNATAFYHSEIEPWAWELTSDSPDTTGQDPGWDPLALAIQEAHARGMELHAYMNVFPAWQGQRFPPHDSNQLWWTHPEWFMWNAAGLPMVPRDGRFGAPRDWYAFISPGNPEVQAYLANVFEEVARNYDVDGIHFDYIRYPAEITELVTGTAETASREESELLEEYAGDPWRYRDPLAGTEGHDYSHFPVPAASIHSGSPEARAHAMGNWSYDSVSLQRFAEETGDESPDQNPAAWTDWRAEQISSIVHEIRQRVDAARPGIMLTASVLPGAEQARATKYQDYVRWMREGWLDGAVTMGYTPSTEVFAQRVEELIPQIPEGARLIPGLSLGNDAETVEAQVAAVRSMPASGFAGFAYSHLFDRDHNHARLPLADALAATVLAQPASLPW